MCTFIVHYRDGINGCKSDSITWDDHSFTYKLKLAYTCGNVVSMQIEFDFITMYTYYTTWYTCTCMYMYLCISEEY